MGTLTENNQEYSPELFCNFGPEDFTTHYVRHVKFMLRTDALHREASFIYLNPSQVDNRLLR